MNPAQHDLYVSPHGNDQWSGRLPEPHPNGSDGPLATVTAARDRIRSLKQTAELPAALTVWLRGGRYRLFEPLVFTPEDSAPVTYAAYPGEQPIFDGGVLITGWRVTGQDGQVRWEVDLPEVAAGRWCFRQLFVNGERRPRARLPKVGPEYPGGLTERFFRMDGVPEPARYGKTRADWQAGSYTFRVAAGDFRNWSHLTEIEVVALHFWIDERLPVAAYDEATCTVTSPRCSRFRLSSGFNDLGARYYLDNVYEALTEPGEWYLERTTGRLTYLPRPGETPESAEVYAPRLMELLRLQGEPDANRYVEFLRFQGLTFEHADWVQPDYLPDKSALHAPPMPEVKYAPSAQAAAQVPAALHLTGARTCAFENCTVRHVGGYAIELADGCSGVRLAGNTLHDLGGGGIKLSGAHHLAPQARRTGDNLICDNHIVAGGRVFHAGVGILARHTFGNRITGNHIHDLFYSGISVGWTWGLAENVARDNRVEGNHIHDLGHGWLSDMGGIYTLGVQPGAVIRRNRIHDIRADEYGGLGIYLDEGSSHIVVEGNLCYRTSSESFCLHYGRENIVRDNVFALGGAGGVTLGRYDATGEHRSLTFERNIVLTDGQPAFTTGYAADYEAHPIISDLNLFWDMAGMPPLAARNPEWRKELKPTYTLDEWRALGYDTHSLVADPGFRDAAAGDFTLAADSPARALGIL